MLVDDIIREIYNTQKFQFKIGEISEMADVSTRQLRYWEKQGYLKSNERTGEQNARVFSFRMYVKSRLIKKFLDDGFTLSKANEKSTIIIEEMEWIHKFATQSHFNLTEVDGQKAVCIGSLNDDESQKIYGFIDDDGVHYRTKS
ncbi:hypothetical protein FC70_GL000965 [Paucilactobacillus oligofermentans DSM 15707 = LMG 22743]|uniref:HTH merR-type domain-containing protein n=1 Tax=Paucilactobacillus oligofermentans DSM 15707 = LMG 22743 TaxID=1423778 RepID=A0A0R1RG72_9LACO|nr:MerR family transcriptional regulator [Paucilactobacillus oligofermentans]KRL55369.1 hypothetical protein FC70_GL000965 [Paucilactobacillus oligofermentans DSM 15707 = LMG 22743]CUS25640.1 GlnR-like HTH domain-containig protein [Paucilactobacillus oligofermentans DSM 15707 = LMG 22743]